MKTKPTPGPWYIKIRQARFDPTIVIEDGVCGLDGEQIKVCGMTLTSSAEAKANSRLVAAAPELLEALQWCIDQGWVRYTSRVKGQNDQYCDAVDKVHAAIAKATGD